ncbi:mitochondrial fission regulator 2 [Tiliqua scincoides]|uniref:mitochondrial fission regulator 2 n=1 Tax=Tiliqua scincoides TaxID=71010 RepID=UPI003462EFDE
MSLLLNLLRQVLEYYGVPPEELLQRCEVLLNGIAHRIEPHLPSNAFSRTHLQQLCAISRNYSMSWIWERKKYGPTRSFVRRLGQILSLTPSQRPHLQLVQNLNSLESEQSRTVTPSLADVLWLADDREPSARFRFDEWNEVVPRTTFPMSTTSNRRAQKGTVVEEDALNKISALEDELARLRAQIAAIVTVHGARNGDHLTCSDAVNSSNSPCSILPKPPITSTPVLITHCNTVTPPPPPPPPPVLLPSGFDPHNSAVELIKQRRAARKIRSVSDSAALQKDETLPSMMDVLKDINKVKLRAVERSPGGTPLSKSKKTVRSQWDPAALIAEALKEKFAAQNNVNDSFDKENRSYDASPFSSPDTPMVGRHIWKPSIKQALNRTEELVQVSATKARVLI